MPCRRWRAAPRNSASRSKAFTSTPARRTCAPRRSSRRRRAATNWPSGWRRKAAKPVRTLNLGGGFGIPYFPGDTHVELAPIRDSLHAIAERAARDLPGAELVIELGRYLVGEAGIYVTRVVDRKESRGQVFLVCDGGLNHQLAASGNFGQVLRKNYPLAIGNRFAEPAAEMAMVVGPLCTPLDLLGDRMHVPRAAIGDLVVVFQSGAYGLTASPRAFLSHPDAVEVLV